MRSIISHVFFFFFGCRKAMGDDYSVQKLWTYHCFHQNSCVYENEWYDSRPIPSLLLLVVAPVTSLLLSLEGEYALCPLRLAFHTLEVRLLKCVAASHAAKTHTNKPRKWEKTLLNGFDRVKIWALKLWTNKPVSRDIWLAHMPLEEASQPDPKCKHHHQTWEQLDFNEELQRNE